MLVEIAYSLKNRVLERRLIGRHFAHALSLYRNFLPGPQFLDRIFVIRRETKTVDDWLLMTVDQNYSGSSHALFGSTDRSYRPGNDHNLSLIELVRLSFVGLIRLVQILGRDSDSRALALCALLFHRFFET